MKDSLYFSELSLFDTITEEIKLKLFLKIRGENIRLT